MKNERITELYAWLGMSSETGEEEIPAVSGLIKGFPIMMPLVYSRESSHDKMQGYAQEIHDRTGITLHLVKFVAIENMAMINSPTTH